MFLPFHCIVIVIFLGISISFWIYYRNTNYQSDLPTDGQQQREREVIAKCLARNKKQCNFFYHENMTIVYKTFTALCFIAGITKDENALAIQEVMNVFMESLVLYFGQVSELDIVFNMERVYMILDEVIINGSVGFTSKERTLLPLQLLDAGS